MGIIETFQTNISLLNRDRTIRVYLPNNYYFENTNYQVLYMHDGHNLFSPETSGYGISWDVHLLLDEFEKLNHENIIVVGIDCDIIHRFDEYSPWKSNKIQKLIPYLKLPVAGGEGDLYIKWLVEELMPIIDHRYRTKKINYLAGSSMGACISRYAAFKYPNVFLKIGCMSTALWFEKAKMISFINENFNSEIGIYLDVGTNEGGNEGDFISQTYLNDTLELVNILENLGTKNLKLYIDKGGIHSETAWKKRFPIFLEWLLK